MQAHLRTPAASFFVGREAELSLLRAGWERALGSEGGVVLLRGEPGIGKTCLADQLAHLAADADAIVLWGRCWENGGAPAYWPWIQMLRVLLRNVSPAVVLAQDDWGVAAITHLVPEVRNQLPGVMPLATETTRAQLFEGLRALLCAAAAHRPLFLVLDDLHAADFDSLHLLAALALEFGAARIFVIGTYRDVEVQADTALSALIGAIAAHATTLRIGGLGTAEVERYIAAMGVADAAVVVHAVHAATGGNPFFLDAVVRELPSDTHALQPRQLDLPAHVRAAIRQRLTHLHSAAVESLAVAAVIGREFSLPLLRRLVGTDSAAAALTAAQKADLVRTNGDTGSFAHGLIGQTLYEDLAATQRLEWHRRIGEAIEDEGSHETQLFALAHHFSAAAAAGGAAKALHYGRRAAERALALMAYHDTVSHYERLLELLPVLEAERGAPDDRQRCELLLGLAEAQRWVGAEDDGIVTCERAAAIARRLHAPELAGRALLHITMVGTAGQHRDARAMALLEDVLPELGAHDSVLRARLLAQQARALLHAPQAVERRQSLADESVAMARRLGDGDTLIHCLLARHFATSRTDNLAARLADAHEAVRLAEQSHHPLETGAHLRLMCDLLERGEVTSAWAHADRFAQAARRWREPLDLWLVEQQRLLRALCTGDLALADRLLPSLFQSALPLQSEYARNTPGFQLMILRAHQGRLDELMDGVERVARGTVPTPAGSATLAWICSIIGNHDAAQFALDAAAQNRFADVPRDTSWLATLASASEACAFVGDRARAAALYGLLEPFAARNVVIGSAVACLGSAAYYLGQLSATAGEFDTAAVHFDAALAANTAMGFRPWLVHTQWRYARMLQTRGGADDRAHAVELLRSALSMAVTMGMRGIEADTRCQLTAIESSVIVSRHCDPTALAPVEKPTFEANDDAWRVSYAGRSVRMHDSKGLRYLAQIVQRDGAVISAVELAQATPGAERARLNVTRAIGKALVRLARVHPELREHLDRTLCAGTLCRYSQAS